MIPAGPEDLVAEVGLVRAGFNGAIVFAEAPSDARLFERVLLGGDHVLVRHAGYKEAVIEVVKGCGLADLGGVLGIVDRDYDDLADLPKNVIATPATDLEMTIVGSSAFDHFIDEFASRTKVARACEDEDVGNVRHLLARRVARIGIARRINAREGLGLKFKNINYKRCIADADLTLNVRRLMASIAVPDVDMDQVATRVENEYHSLSDDNEELLAVCNGHDLIEFLARGLKRYLGNLRDIDTSVLSAALHLSVGPGQLSEVSLATSIREWESDSGFQVIAP